MTKTDLQKNEEKASAVDRGRGELVGNYKPIGIAAVAAACVMRPVFGPPQKDTEESVSYQLPKGFFRSQED